MTCSSCLKSNLKQSYTCSLCHHILCKNCTQFLDNTSFSFLEIIPDNLKHSTYCGSCYDSTVAPAQETYNITLKKAENLFLFDKGDKQVPLIKRSNGKITIENCEDKQNAVLKLAFLAAQKKFNAVVDIERFTKKLNKSGYQTTLYGITGYPAMIDESRLPHS
ncbi:hypothetical protein K1X76_08380 [bacterium]|nr:hypothetical protein [bacterium]